VGKDDYANANQLYEMARADDKEDDLQNKLGVPVSLTDSMRLSTKLL